MDEQKCRHSCTNSCTPASDFPVAQQDMAHGRNGQRLLCLSEKSASSVDSKIKESQNTKASRSLKKSIFVTGGFATCFVMMNGRSRAKAKSGRLLLCSTMGLQRCTARRAPSLVHAVIGENATRNLARPVDWGPNERTKRVLDITPLQQRHSK
jgi:hypothetical protein